MGFAAGNGFNSVPLLLGRGSSRPERCAIKRIGAVGKTIRVLATWLVVFVAVSCAEPNAAHAQNLIGGFFESIFGGPQARRVPNRRLAVVDDASVKADFTNQYSPFLKTVLTAELHFAKKICDPSDEQFADIHRAGLLGVAVTSKLYEDLQKNRQNASQWPAPSVRISTALQAKIDQVMPDDVAKRYRDEIAARAQTHQEAAVGMMLVQIDSLLLLDPDQHDELTQVLKEKWNPQWSSGPRLYMYPQYARFPELHVLEPHLSDLQRTLWSQRNNNSSVNFGWQLELGMQDNFGGGIELEAFDPPEPAKIEPAQPERAEETDDGDSSEAPQR